MEGELAAMRAEMSRLKKEAQTKERTEGKTKKIRKKKAKKEFAGAAEAL